MPTGYTHKIAKGITFAEFAMDCARSFGACIELRDQAGGGEAIPNEFKPSDYHSVAAEKARARLDGLRAMTPEQVVESAERERMDAERERMDSERRRMKCREERDSLRAKYETMLGQVRAWAPPTPDHVRLKSFMRDQIEESIRFDCMPFDWPKSPPPSEWLAGALERAERDVAYHEKEYEKEVESARSRTEWVRALRESLQ